MNKLYYIFIALAMSLAGCSSIPDGQYEDIGQYGYKDIYVQERKPVIYPDMIVSDIISVYDGDTMRVNLTSPKGLPDLISKNVSIRFDGIDTPEIRGNSRRLTKIAKEAKAYTEKRLREGNIIILTRVQRGKYFRILAEVEVDGSNLNQELLDKGLAKPYFGGSKIGLWDNRYKKDPERERKAKEREQERKERSINKKVNTIKNNLFRSILMGERPTVKEAKRSINYEKQILTITGAK
jgi:endonuclease YncB( thermonuclease family)